MGNIYIPSALLEVTRVRGISRMGKSEEYRRYARECLELASALRMPRARAALNHMAQVWMRLAQDVEDRSSEPRADAVSELG